jgi:4-hydroxy-tetrahydrodipicolinate synthase
MMAMIQAYLRGEVAEAARLHGQLRAINRALFLQPNPVPVKKALALCGFPVGGLRPPMKEASDSVVRELKQALEGLGL